MPGEPPGERDLVEQGESPVLGTPERSGETAAGAAASSSQLGVVVTISPDTKKCAKTCWEDFERE